MNNRVAIVVPTIREHSIRQFIEEWKLERCVDLIIVEDNPVKTFILNIDGQHYSHEDIEKEFTHPEIVGRKTDAVRIFGFWKAWKQGYDYILTLDDDCYPRDKQTIQQLIDSHLSALRTEVPNNQLFHTLNHGYARGTPTFLKKKIPIKLSVGGWCKVPDIDGKTQLFIEQEGLQTPSGKGSPEIVPYGAYYTMCGMHVFFPIELVKYMYYFPTLDTYHRWADIWLGFCLKRLADAEGWAIINSAAVVKHSRASNAQKNFEKESTNDGYGMNDKVAEIIQTRYVENFNGLIDVLKHNFAEEYFKTITDYYQKWHDIFEVKHNGT